MKIPVHWYMLGISVFTSVTSASGLLELDDGQVVENAIEMFGDRDDDLTEQIDKRSVLGHIADNAIKGVLNGAKFLSTNGLDSYFLKQGGPVKAVEDFYSLKPKYTTVSKIYGTIVHMQGNVGTWRVIFRHDESTERTTITMAKGLSDYFKNKYDNVGEKIIIYTG